MFAPFSNESVALTPEYAQILKKSIAWHRVVLCVALLVMLGAIVLWTRLFGASLAQPLDAAFWLEGMLFLGVPGTLCIVIATAQKRMISGLLADIVFGQALVFEAQVKDGMIAATTPAELFDRRRTRALSDGMYRFVFAPNSLIILESNAIARTTPKALSDFYQQTIVNRFTRADEHTLETNRRGHLTLAQHLQRASTLFSGCLAMAILSGFVFVLLPLVSNDAVFFRFIFYLVWGLSAVAVIYGFPRLLAEWLFLPVRHAEGRPEIVSASGAMGRMEAWTRKKQQESIAEGWSYEEGGNVYTYRSAKLGHSEFRATREQKYVRFDQQILRLDHALADFIDQKNTWRIHFLALSKTVLSIEKL